MNAIISWNVNSLFSKYPFVQLLLRDFNPSVFCIQETKLLPSHSLFLKNFVVFRYDNLAPGNAKGGVLIAVSHKYHAEPIILNTPFQSTAVRVFFDTPITICTLYLHHHDLVTADLLYSLIKQLPPPYILTGDFNAHSEMWGSSHTDTRGAVFESLLLTPSISLLNSGQPTRFNMYSGDYSAIDVTLCSSTLVSKLRWSILESSYTSDHFPQHIEIVSSVPQSTFSPLWKYQDADWDTFTQLVDFSGIDSCSTATEMAALIENSILAAAAETIPQSRPHTGKYRVPWWDEHCEKAIKKKRNSWRFYKRHPTDENLTKFKITRAIARRTIYEAKRTHWRNYISKINSSVPPTILWKRIRSIANRRTYEPIPAIRNERGELISEMEEITQIFSNFYSASTHTNDTPSIESIPPPNEEDEDPINHIILLSEVKEAVKHQRNTAAGPDNIHASMLKHLNYCQLKYLTKFFNHIWTKHDFPEQWRLAHIIPIRKPGKDGTIPASYRPISLTNVLCKILERIVVKRLHAKLTQSGKLDKFQCGFKPGNSTTDSLIHLSEEIKTGFAQKQHTVGVFFDIEKAFDRIQPLSVLKSLHELGLGGNTFYFVQNFLRDRIFQVRLGHIFSQQIRQLTGTPQGSVLSPLLFTLAINNIQHLIHYPVRHLLYADDLVLFIRGNNLPKSQNRLQSTIDKLADWGNDHGLSFAPTKTKVINFTKKRNSPSVQLFLDEEPLTQTQSTKFLGLIFDHTLTWKQHIQSLRQKCSLRLNLLKTLNGTSWGADKKSLIRLYCSHIRSLLDYGSVVYSTASLSTLKKLDTMQNQALRIASGAFRTSPIASINVETNTMSLTHRRHIHILNYYGKLLSEPDHINSYRANSSNHPGSIRKTAEQLSEIYEISLEQLKEQPNTKLQRQIIQRAIQARIQHLWTTDPHLYLLRTIKPVLQNWITSYNSSRQKERVLARVRIGHTRITHIHLIQRTDSPICNSCHTSLTLIHILNDCTQYAPQRIHFYGSSPYRVYDSLGDDKVKIDIFYKFLQESNLYSVI